MPNNTNDDTVVSLEAVEQELDSFFDGDKELCQEWLNTPIPRLNGKLPSQLLSSNAGRTQVLQVLGEMKYGDMA